MEEPDVVELRVHGVSGTPPEDLLDRPLVRQVAGDHIAGFYRPRLAEEWTDQAVDEKPGTGPYLEGYAWGGFTSGSPSRALWLLLLPFTLINTAPRLRPAGSIDWKVAFLITVSRLLALSLTVTLTLATAGVTMDVLAWQCGANPEACQALPAFFKDWQDWAGPGGRLVFGALGAMGMVWLLALLSRSTSARYEAVKPPAFEKSGSGTAWDPGLDDSWLWYGKDMVKRQRTIHMQAGLLSVVAMISLILDSDTGSSTLLQLPVWASYGLYWAAIVLLAVLAGLLGVPVVTGRGPDVPWLKKTRRSLWTVTAVLVAAGLVAAVLTSPAPVPERVGLRAYAVTITLLFGAQMIAVLLLGALTFWLLRSPPAAGSPPPPLCGYGGVALALISVLLGAALSAGAYLFAWSWVRGRDTVPRVSGPAWLAQGESIYTLNTLVPPSMLVAVLGFVVAVGWALFLVVAFGAWAAFRWFKPSARDVANLDGDYPQQKVTAPRQTVAAPLHVKRTAQRDRKILWTFWVARRVDYAGLALGFALVPMALLAVVLTFFAVAALFWQSPAGIINNVLSAGGLLGGWGPTLLGLAIYLIVLLPVGLVLLAQAMFRVRRTRRVVGILWDLISFWPQSVHPFAAPCYAERTVPDLLARIRYHLSTATSTQGVVLAGHSQGSVITAAALMQLHTADDDVNKSGQAIPRLAFLSYGCVLRRLYMRYYPAYFGPATLNGLAAMLRDTSGIRWRNLWQHSDYLGGPVADGGNTANGGVPTMIDQRFIDPRYAPVDGDLADPPAGRHSRYPRNPEFQVNVKTLVHLLPPSLPGLQPQPDTPPTVM